MVEIDGKKALIQLIEIDKKIYKQEDKVSRVFTSEEKNKKDCVDYISLIPDLNIEEMIVRLIVGDELRDKELKFWKNYPNAPEEDMICFDYIGDWIYEYCEDNITLDELLNQILQDI